MAVLPFIYLAIIISWSMLVLAFAIDDWVMKSLVSIFFMVLGVEIMINGIEGLINIAVTAFGIVHFAVGGFIILAETYEFYKEM